MGYDISVIDGRRAEWAAQAAQAELPDWEQLPPLDLYMDQVILLLRRYLAPLSGDAEKSITASIINNYVRMRIIPPPVKKKYSRVHMAELIVLCTLKRSLSIACVRRLLPAQHEEKAVRELYEAFLFQFRQVRDALTSPEKPGASLPLPAGEGELLLSAALISNLTVDLTEYLLAEPPAAT